MDTFDEKFINDQFGNTPKEDNMGFLPDSYEVPQSAGNYMKFEQGENRFRIMTSPILGYEWWVDSEDGKRQPIRVPMDGKVPAEYADEVKHFWAMVVWNYQAKRIQILEITQKTIQRAIKATAKSKWGDPKGNDGYDFLVTKEGVKKETEYTVMPEPKEKLSEEVIKAFEETKVNLNALFDGEDPFIK